MKKIIHAAIITLALLAATRADATFSSGSTGADGALNPTSNTQLQVPSNGIFNFTTVNIPSNVTVTFIKNAANTPVFMLATGDITINGTINLNGSNGSGLTPGIGGPGAFGGGIAITSQVGTSGMGPGGGLPATGGNCYGGGGGFTVQGSKWGTGGASCPDGGPAYGSTDLQQLIGGSGGGSGISCAGGGGGGAILIASSGTIYFNGTVSANGGAGADCALKGGGGGSGGAVRMVSNTLSGNGTIYVNGNLGGSVGRLRYEANSVVNRTVGPIYTYPLPGEIITTTTQPTFTIDSIGGITPPANPLASYASPDVRLPSNTTNPVPVVISATNIPPTDSTVTVRIIPQSGTPTTVSGTLSGTLQSSTATISVTIPTGLYSSLIMATVTYTPQIAMYWHNEKIDKVRIAATFGGRNETTYITQTGKEIPGLPVAGTN